MVTVDIHEAKTHRVALLARVAEPVVFGTLDASWAMVDDAFSDETDALVAALLHPQDAGRMEHRAPSRIVDEGDV